MNYFKNLVYKHDYVNIKKYLHKVFSYGKGLNKTSKFYKAICLLYLNYPETVKMILDNVNEWGYYKDYMYMLYYIDYMCKKVDGYSYERKQDGKYVNVDPEECKQEYNKYKQKLGGNVEEQPSDPHYTHKYMSDKLKYNKNYKITKIYKKNLYYTRKLDNLKRYIYEILVTKLKEDATLHREGKTISTLAKWLPRSKHMFTKKIKDFMKIFTNMYYGNLDSYDDEHHVLARYINYEKLIIKLSKYLDVAEYYIKSGQLDKINFDRMPLKCLITNKKAFIKDPVCEYNFGQHIYNKFKDHSLVYLVKVVMNHDMVAIEKQAYNRIFVDMLSSYQSKIMELLNIDVAGYDVLVDLSNEMFNNKNVDMIIAVLIVLNSLGCNIIINSKRCTIKKLSGDFCNDINLLSYSMIDYDGINIESASRLTGKKLLIITNKDKVSGNCDGNIFVVLDKYTTFTKVNDNLYVGNMLYKHIIKNNKQLFMDILNKSVELNTERVTSVTLLTRLSIVTIGFTIFVNCMLFFLQFFV